MRHLLSVVAEFEANGESLGILNTVELHIALSVDHQATEV